LPRPVNFEGGYYEDDQEFNLQIKAIDDINLTYIRTGSLKLFPLDWGIVDNAATPQITTENDVLIFTQKRGDRDLNQIDMFNGVLTFETLDNKQHALSFTGKPVSSIAVDSALSTGHTLFTALIFAFLGGLILNLMPCVFPVLSLKALSLAKLQGKEQRAARLNGLSYTAGITLSFIAIAAVLIILKAFGASIGWGFQLQNPVIVALLAYTLFMVGLNFAGVFDVHFGGVGGGKTAQKLTGGTGIGASFFTGVLAAVVAAPCVAPFMASAIGYALTQSTAETLSIFAALGLGLAAPYLLLCFVPSLQKFMPKPGAWMDTFKQLLAFPMFASAAWLVWILSKQIGDMAVLGALLGFVALAFAMWLLHHRPPRGQKWHKRITVLVGLSILLAFGFLPLGYDNVQTDAQKSIAEYETKRSENFSPAALDAALQTPDPVFVEMTAAWCITCKVNHKTSINIEATKRLFAEENVQYLVGDWTNQDGQITAYLEKFARSGVPLYVFYARPDPQTGVRPDPVVLPQILTPSIVAHTVRGNR
jgi:thiol:disulfide interchange protein